MKYNGYLIVTEPEYNELIAKGEDVGDLWCGVYDENDTEKKYMLGDFNIVKSTIYNDCLNGRDADKSLAISIKDEIESTIMSIVQEDSPSYELAKCMNEIARMKGVLENVIAYMGESFDSQEEFVTVLKETVGIADEELEHYCGITQDEMEEGLKMV